MYIITENIFPLLIWTQSVADLKRKQAHALPARATCTAHLILYTEGMTYLSVMSYRFTVPPCALVAANHCDRILPIYLTQNKEVQIDSFNLY